MNLGYRLQQAANTVHQTEASSANPQLVVPTDLKKMQKCTSKDEPEPVQTQIKGFLSQRRQIQRTDQQHQERAMTATFTRKRQNRQQQKTTDEPKPGQTQIRGFLSRRCQQSKQPAVIRLHCNPLVHNAWNKKKKAQTHRKQQQAHKEESSTAHDRFLISP